jgi:hypothetical protein
VSESVYFVQECPTCGRSLRIRVGYLGKHVVCQHCHGRFQACDPASPSYPPVDSGIDLLRRADELLELSSLQSLGSQTPSAQSSSSQSSNTSASSTPARWRSR